MMMMRSVIKVRDHPVIKENKARNGINARNGSFDAVELIERREF